MHNTDHLYVFGDIQNNYSTWSHWWGLGSLYHLEAYSLSNNWLMCVSDDHFGHACVCFSQVLMSMVPFLHLWHLPPRWPEFNMPWPLYSQDPCSNYFHDLFSNGHRSLHCCPINRQWSLWWIYFHRMNSIPLWLAFIFYANQRKTTDWEVFLFHSTSEVCVTVNLAGWHKMTAWKRFTRRRWHFQKKV